MQKPTQEQLDEMIRLFREELVSKIGDKSAAVAMVINKDVSAMIANYELDMAPSARSMGLKAPTISELLGVNIKVSV